MQRVHGFRRSSWTIWLVFKNGLGARWRTVGAGVDIMLAVCI